MAVALVASTLSGAIGMGGGVLLLTVMSDFFSTTVLIPIHGAVQLASNLSRSIINRSGLNYRMIALFLAGASLGALAGSRFLREIPEDQFKLLLACGILILTWLPKKKVRIRFRSKFFFVGFLSQFLSLFVGAIGPFIAPFFLHDDLSKKEIVATKAGCQTGVHIFKILVYFLTGFSIGEYLPTITLLALTVVLGNYLGKLILEKISEKNFALAFRVLISLLAVRMVVNVFLD